MERKTIRILACAATEAKQGKSKPTAPRSRLAAGRPAPLHVNSNQIANRKEGIVLLLGFIRQIKEGKETEY